MYEAFQEVEDKFGFAVAMDGQSIEKIQTFLDESIHGKLLYLFNLYNSIITLQILSDNCEGLMVKVLEGPESTYEPSKRSRNWLKVMVLSCYSIFYASLHSNNMIYIIRSKKIIWMVLVIHWI
jgi:hypothetical protein